MAYNNSHFFLTRQAQTNTGRLQPNVSFCWWSFFYFRVRCRTLIGLKKIITLELWVQTYDWEENMGFCQLRICRSPSHFYDRWCAQCWIKWKSIFRSLFFELWMIVFTIYRWHTGIFKCDQSKIKSYSKVVRLTEKMRNELKRMKN